MYYSVAWPDRFLVTEHLLLAVKVPVSKKVWSYYNRQVVFDTSMPTLSVNNLYHL